jgi:hypothetical protein
MEPVPQFSIIFTLTEDKVLSIFPSTIKMIVFSLGAAARNYNFHNIQCYQHSQTGSKSLMAGAMRNFKFV